MGVVKSLLVSAAVLIFVMKFIIAGTVNLGAFFDRMFVNGLGLPVNSGITFFALALAGGSRMGRLLDAQAGQSACQHDSFMHGSHYRRIRFVRVGHHPLGGEPSDEQQRPE